MELKKKMVHRLTGATAVSAHKLAEETGVSQESLSLWLRQSHNLPIVAKKRKRGTLLLADKVRILAAASKLTGEELAAYLAKEAVHPGELEQWRFALDNEGRSGAAVIKRIRELERELARKEKALAEAAALLILKKKVETLFSEDADDDTDEDCES
jgi:transposase